MKQYYAIIADLIGSKKIENRHAAQEQIKEALDYINQKYKKQIASKFSLTLGDEFQGLLTTGENIFQIIDEIDIKIPAYPCRFGIGLGTMATAINPEQSLGADGEAYWKAREAIEYVHNNDDYEMTRTHFCGLTDSEDLLVNDSLALSDGLKARWTEVQWGTFAKLIEENIYGSNFDQKRLAKKLSITEQALYRRLKLSQMKVYLRSRSNLQAFVAERGAKK